MAHGSSFFPRNNFLTLGVRCLSHGVSTQSQSYNNYSSSLPILCRVKNSLSANEVDVVNYQSYNLIAITVRNTRFLLHYTRIVRYLYLIVLRYLSYVQQDSQLICFGIEVKDPRNKTAQGQDVRNTKNDKIKT